METKTIRINHIDSDDILEFTISGSRLARLAPAANETQLRNRSPTWSA